MHAEDRVIIHNVVAAIEALKLEKILLSWTIDTGQTGFVVNGDSIVRYMLNDVPAVAV